MKNITVTVSDDVYREARVHAAAVGTSVSALVTQFLMSLQDREAEFARLEAKRRKVVSQIKEFSAGDRLTRDEIHERAVR